VKRSVPDDLKDLVLRHDEVEKLLQSRTKPPPKGRSRVESKSRFIIFPMEWHRQLATVEAEGATYRVAFYLLYECWRSQTNRMKLPNIGLRQWGVGRRGKRSALDQLGRLGLISCDRARGKSPVVTVKLTD
jgi:hypothetical protein